MDVNFHYYATYLIASRAGYSPADARIIAHSCQLVDDNTHKYRIDAGGPSEYCNYISQTESIAKPANDLLRIYLFHHFMPGDIDCAGCRRKDGKFHLLNTTPCSANAKNILEQAIATGDLYLIGIACHMMADSFSHQNFIGYYDDMNAMSGALQAGIPNIGHADALTKPDEIGLIWSDDRLMRAIRNNNKIFVDAAQTIFLWLNCSCDNFKASMDEMSVSLSVDLCNAFNRWTAEERIQAMKQLARKPEYGGEIPPDYNEKLWFDQAVINDRPRALSFLPARYVWRSSEYKRSHWYCFQEAVRRYQDICWGILNESVFSKICLKNL